MKNRTKFPAVLLVIGILGSACGSDSNPTPSPSQPSQNNANTAPDSGKTQETLKNSTVEVPANADSAGFERKNGVYISLRFADTKAPIQEGCTGTIVSKDLILTAAHCFSPYEYAPNRGRPVEPNEIIFGDPGKSDAIHLPAISFLANPKYTTFGEINIYHDIAWVKVDQIPVGFNAMPVYKYSTPFEAKQKVFFYGASRKNPRSGEAEVTVPDFICLKATCLVQSEFRAKMITLAKDYGIIEGDSGGPLYVSDQGKWMITGVLSTKMNLDDPNGQMLDNYVAISPHAEWIKKTAGEEL